MCKTAAECVGARAHQVADQRVVVGLEGKGANRNHVHDEGDPREEYEEVGPKVHHVIVEHARVSEVVRERESIASVSSANEGLPENRVDVLFANDTQSPPSISLSLRRRRRRG